MNELVYLKNDEAVCSSLLVAEKFEKRHADVMRAIDNLVENDSTQNCVQCFKRGTYKDSTGKSNKMYVMNRDGFTFLVMGFTGKKANEWKWQYIKAFNQMEKFIREKQTKIWIETRKAGKLTRKAETDTIKNLVEYAKAQGSQHADKLYMTYSKLANKMAGVSKRDEATTPRGSVFTEVTANGSVQAKLEWNPSFARTKAENFSKAQEFVDSECLRYMNPLTPRRTGMMIKSATLGTVIGSGSIEYLAPYARRQYYEHKSKARWFEKMKASNKETILKGAEQIAGR